jgi:8-oxo-dGTP pyrophosphatase MutT (NUDIX family)
MRPGESPEDTAARECQEETGLRVSPRGRYSTVVEQYAHGTVEANFVACQLVDVSCDPRAPFRWVAAAELGSFEFPAANAELIRQLSRPAQGQVASPAVAPATEAEL